MKLRIKKATYHIQRSYPWINREDVEILVKQFENEFEKDEPKLTSQDIIDLICDICKDI